MILMTALKTPPGFDSETSFVLWEAVVADRCPAYDDEGKFDYWRHFRLKRRRELPDAELYRVAEHDPDPEARRLAAAEVIHRREVLTRALLGDETGSD